MQALDAPADNKNMVCEMIAQKNRLKKERCRPPVSHGMSPVLFVSILVAKMRWRGRLLR
jgi:hypothetical protein